MRNKILMTLVLLLTAATGAWAWTSGGCTVNYDNNGNMTVSKNGNGQMADIDYLYNRAWTSVASSVTNLVIEEGVTKIGSATFMNFTSITEITIPNSVTTIGDDAFTACTAVTKVTIGSGVTNIAQDAFYNIMYVTDVYCYADPANLTWNENNNDFGQYVETKCHVPAEYLDAYKAKFNGHVHVTFVALPDLEVTPVAEPAANTLQWTFTMPGSNVVLTPLYAPTATWTVVEEVSQVPTAAEGVVAGTNAKIVTPGKTTQGTVMYAVTSTATAPALTAFSATVPTADFLEGTYETEQTVYVWYYIKGADTPANTEATEENTFNDSEICAEPLTVVLQPNVFDITFNPANANTIEAGKATVTVGGTAATVTEGKLEGVKMGSEVKMTAKEGYKFRKAEAKKGGGEPEYYDQLSAGYNVTINVINSYVWSHNIFGQVGFTSGISGSIWNAMTITKEQAIALAEYKGSTSLVLYDKGEGSDDGYGGKNVLYKFAKSDGTTVDIERHVNIKNNPSILEGYTVYYIPKNAN